MKRPFHPAIIALRVGFVALCGFAAWLVCYSVPEWDHYWGRAMVIGTCIGSLVVLFDMLLKGFSLRALSAVTFGLAVGSLVSFLLGSSPLFERGDEQFVYLSRLALFLICTYLGAALALRGRDEFNLLIPFVRFVPQGIESSLVVVDASALMDGRVVRLCETGFVGPVLVVPQFVIDEVHRSAESGEAVRSARGRRGLDTLRKLRALRQIELREQAGELEKQEDYNARIIYACRSLKARLLTTEPLLGRMAEAQAITWLNLAALTKALAQEVAVGESVNVDLVRPGKEEGQAVGFLEDGSMVVVVGGRPHLGRRLNVEVTGITPSAAGRIVFGRPGKLQEDGEARIKPEKVAN